MDGDTREKIREVALELFSTRGFDQTSLREIAERVGLTKASLYYHYPSKQALLSAIVAPLVDGWQAVMDIAARSTHSSTAVREILARILDVMLENRALVGIFMRDPAGVLAAAEPIWQDMIDMGNQLTAWLAGPAPSVAEQLRAIAAVEVLGAALSSSAYFKEEVSDEEMREVLLDSALGAMRL
jgi:AcrR family transcriptional regulator